MTGLRALRKAAGKTIDAVSRDLGMNERTLRRLEKGETPIRDIHAHAFAAYYGVTVAQITAPCEETAA